MEADLDSMGLKDDQILSQEHNLEKLKGHLAMNLQ